MRIFSVIFISIIFQLTPLMSQEICDNGVDDDFDGLVDLNDPDCECELLVPASLIPNPSFEDKTCCPTMNAQLDCAVSWVQASAPTTDYVHTCANYLGNTNIPAYAPLPFPDGDGAVGFRDGQEYVGPNYKEYVGACLTQPMVVGNRYRLDFFVGFRDQVPGSMDLDIAIFGSSNCANLPFGGTSNTIGCPVNTGNYTEIDVQSVSGSNEWKNVVFEFYADKPYEVLILGPACKPNPDYQRDPYFYLDRLVFAESSEFGEPFQEINGSICENNLVLQVEYKQDYSYQWYLDGIALAGENGPSLELTTNKYGEGVYQVRIISEAVCYLSSEYELRIPPYYESLDKTICSNEFFLFGSQELTEEGYYERLIAATDGCDSIIQLTLNVLEATESYRRDTICAHEVFEFLDIIENETGIYTTVITNQNGCDSTITVDLMALPEGKDVSLPDQIETTLGNAIDLAPYYVNPEYSGFYWSNEYDSLLVADEKITDFLPINTQQLFFNAKDEFGCPVRDSILIRVLKNNYTLYIPNVFTPNGDNLNDLFNFRAPPSLSSIKMFAVYDRWGNLVFKTRDLYQTQNNWGWDGTFKGHDSVAGVYTYLIEAIFIDGESRYFTGDITLIR